MPLLDGYGVVIGALRRYYADPAEDYGDYYHANLDVVTPRGTYRCKLDVDGKTPHGLLWRVVELPGSSLSIVSGLSDGWHDLERRRGSGALDYIRSPELQPNGSPSYVVVDPTLELVRRVLGRAKAAAEWRRGTREEALADLTAILEGARRVYVYGEPFNRGRGVHNVHQNQGDPKESRWAYENGIWQDGAVVVERSDGTFAAYLTKYATQADRTDRHGHPL
jgi:hypothetical protein